jgi:AcrR family transcriptional regulator
LSGGRTELDSAGEPAGRGAAASGPMGPGRRIKQDRGRKTYARLVQTAFELLERNELESISIASLTRAAGYSVGAFYARFRSKDEFFEAMLAEHIASRTRARNRLFATLADGELVNALIEDLVTSYWKRRRFWRAALIRGTRQPERWESLRKHGRELGDLLVSRITARTGRPLSPAEDANVRFACQVTLGAINNAIINRPGPVFMGQGAFIDNLARAFRLVSDYDRLMGLATPRGSAKANARRE